MKPFIKSLLLAAILASPVTAANNYIELEDVTLTGETLYVVVKNEAGNALTTGTTFAAYTETRGNFDQAMSDGDATGSFRYTLPSVAAGRLTWTIYQQVGGSPSHDDDIAIKDGDEFWNGTAFGADVRAFGGTAGKFHAGRPWTYDTGLTLSAGAAITPESTSTLIRATNFPESFTDGSAPVIGQYLLWDDGIDVIKKKIVGVQPGPLRLELESPLPAEPVGGELIVVTSVPPQLDDLVDQVDDATETIQDSIDDLAQDVTTFTPSQRAQILAALSIGEETGVHGSLTFVIKRIDGEMKAVSPVPKNAEEEVEVFADFRGVLAPGDAIEPDDGILAIELIDDEGSETIDSPAFEDLEAAELWMSSGVKFLVTDGTIGDTDRIRVRVRTVSGQVLSAPCTVNVKGGL